MSNSDHYAQILEFPFAASLLNAQLDAIYENVAKQELVIDYRELRLTDEPQIFKRQEHYVEQIRGEYIPRRLRFRGVQNLIGPVVYEQLNALPGNDMARSLQGILYWRAPDDIERFLLFNTSSKLAAPLFSSGEYLQEERSGSITPVELIREFSSPPLLPVGPVSRPEELYLQYGGDPVTINLDGKPSERCLFVGGLEEQHTQRPNVDVVLNLSEKPSLWATVDVTHAADRWSVKGEGEAGMGLSDILDEAQWVAERLRNEQSVLVHCSAGFNRSVTICCAVLIILEGLKAQAALTRIREHHPWARPDGHHWLQLQGLAYQNSNG